MLPGERWKNRRTGELVRIEVQAFGLLSFSVLRDGEWQMCRHVWDAEQFRKEFVIVPAVGRRSTNPSRNVH